jgi:hypothetical protein
LKSWEKVGLLDNVDKVSVGGLEEVAKMLGLELVGLVLELEEDAELEELAIGWAFALGSYDTMKN